MENNGGITSERPAPPYTEALARHFVDLRDGTHGGVGSRQDKERVFARTVSLLSPHAVRVLDEVNAQLLGGSGTVHDSGLQRGSDGGAFAAWMLSWPEQRESGILPITLQAFYGAGFHHPHLRGATVRDWPLNVFTPQQAAAEVPTLRAIASADLHNLVYQRDFRIVPAVMRPAANGKGTKGDNAR